MRLLLLEDDADLRPLMSGGLEARGFAVTATACIADARAALARELFDVAVIDRQVPDGDGLTLLPDLAMLDVPALVVTARDAVADRIAGLDHGAGDYVIKPFSLDELAARLRAALRRRGAPGRLSTCGALSFDPDAQEVRLAGARLPLGRREAALLGLLIEQAPRTLVRDRIEDRLYGLSEAVTPNAIDALVSRLRRRLAPAGFRIRVVRGIGWRLETLA